MVIDYDWGNPSLVMLSGDDQSTQELHRTTFSDHSGSHRCRQLFHPYAQTTCGDSYFTPRRACSHHPSSAQVQTQSHPHYSLGDCRSLCFGFRFGSRSFLPPQPAGVLDCLHGIGSGFELVPKTEDEFEGHNPGPPPRLGLNLGCRNTFSGGEDDSRSRLYRRPWAMKAEPGSSSAAAAPRCAADGCSADLVGAKHYNRRHKVCEFHSKATSVLAGGMTQRFCQQCSRFHVLSAFDNAKRSCRKRLADHNRRRRRKSNGPKKEISQLQDAGFNSSFETDAGSPHESRVQ